MDNFYAINAAAAYPTQALSSFCVSNIYPMGRVFICYYQLTLKP